MYLFFFCFLTVDRNNLHLNAECSYLQRRYCTCIELCNDLLQLQDLEASHVGSINYLKGKALYQYFILEQYKLNLNSLTEDIRKEISKQCYKLNTMAIELLAESIDCGYVPSEEELEASNMLDRAMMDCIYKANLLNTVHRCYMCRRKLAPGENLIKSHVIPRAVLEIMAADDVGNKQVFFEVSSSFKDRLITPGEMNYYMLCSICEQTVSKHGEIQFPELIFRKIYDNAVAEQTMEYGPWLYQFCISLLFRAFNLDSTNAYTNEKQVYETFKKCHNYVKRWLESPGEDRVTVINIPKVYIFISPVKGGREDLYCGYFSWFLRGGLNSFFSNNGDPELKLYAQYFTIQVNLINIVVRIFDDSSEDMFEKFIIHPEGGHLWIPPEHQRKVNIPRGIWLMFRKLSKRAEKSVEKFEHIIYKSIKGSQIEQSRFKNGAPISLVGEGMVADAAPFLKHEVFKLHHSYEMLPPQFTVNPRSKGNKVILPQGHTILLHSNYVRGPRKGSTFFIAIGNSKKYSVDKPYVLWYFYDPLMEVSCGAFFSIDSYEITSFLASEQRMDMKAMANSSLTTARERMPQILKDLLQEKGFSSMHSLLDRVKSAIRVGM